jgi:type III pantothenate kinase
VILDLDIGNTRVKWRLLKSDKSPQDCGISPSIEDLMATMIDVISGVSRVRVSCVSEQQQFLSFDRWLRNGRGFGCEVVQVEGYAAGVTNGYDKPEQLGADRWLVVCAANALVPASSVVVDAGSALTVDLVAASGEHRGGYIVPGIKLMADALLRDTEQVIFQQNEIPEALGPGRSTQQAVMHGILQLPIALIEATVHDFAARERIGLAYGGMRSHRQNVDSAAELTLLLTGGDAAVLAKFLTIPHTIVPDLVFQGIEILMP